MNTFRCEEYGLAQFLEKFQKAINDGWMLDLTTNENYPTKWGDQYYAVLIPNPDFNHKECEECKAKIQALKDKATQAVAVDAIDVAEAPVEATEPVVKKKTKKV